MMYNQKDWTKFIADWNSMKYSNAELAKKHGFKNGDCVSAKVTVLRLSGHKLLWRDKKPYLDETARFIELWNDPSVTNRELVKKSKLSSWLYARQKASVLRGHGIEMTYNRMPKKPKAYKKPSRRYVRHQAVIPIETLTAMIPDRVKLSIITSYKNGSPLDINAQLHDMSQRTVKAIITQYQQNRA